MKRRIAEIVTRFSTEGLAELRRAIREVGDDARRAQAASGSKGIAGQLSAIGKAARDARRHTSGLKSDLASPQSFIRGLREIKLGFGGIGREIFRIGSEWKRVDGSIAKGAANTARRVARAFGDIGKGLGRSILAGVLLGSTALGRIGSVAGKAAGAVVDAFTTAGRVIAKTVFSKVGIIGAAITALGAGAYQLLTPALGVGALGVAGLAGWFTSVDLKAVKQASESLNLPPEVIQGWQALGNQVDLTIDDVTGAMETLRGKITEALDPEDEAAGETRKLLRMLGIQARYASGQLRPVPEILKDLAIASRRLSPEGRAFAFDTLLGDASKYSELMRSVATDWDFIQSKFNKRTTGGLFASAKDIRYINSFRIEVQDLWLTFKAFSRELYIAFIPVFLEFGKALEGSLSTTEKRAGVIEKFFVKPFRDGYKWISDFARVFFGFDIDKSIFGRESGEVVNTWMFTLRKVLWDVWEVGTGLGRLFLGIGKAVLAAARAFDDFVLKQSGFSISSWIETSAGADVGAFFSDLGDVAANAFSGAFAGDRLRTALGRWISGGVETLKSEVEPVRAYLAAAMAQTWQAAQNGTGLDGVDNALARTLVFVGQVMVALTEFGQQFYKVFFGGQSAGPGFEFLDQLKSAFDYALAVVKEIASIVGSLLGSFGPEIVAKAIVAKLGIDTLAKFATPTALVAGATAGFYALGKNLMPSKVTDNDTDEARRFSEGNDAAFLASGGPKPGLREAYEAGTREYEARDRSLAGAYFEDQMADAARRDAEKAANEPATAKLGSVDVIAQGVPVILQIGRDAISTIAPLDATDQLIRAAAALSGRR